MQTRRFNSRILAGTLAVLAAVAFSLVTAPEALAQSEAPVYPDLISLPGGFGPEGIAVGSGSTFFVGAAIGSNPSLLGQILAGDLRTGGFSQLVAPTGLPALGLKFDSRNGLLFAAGGPTGTGRVYDTSSGNQVAFYQFAPPGSAFINDVVVTRNAAYFTNSATAVLYRVALGWLSQPSSQFDAIPLPPVFGPVVGSCGPAARANGIVADPSGERLIIANSTRGEIYRMDTATQSVIAIGLGGALVCGADGLLLDGTTLYVVSSNRVAVVELSPDFSAGTIRRYITEPFASNPVTQVPTTIAEFGNSLYAVTAGFAPPAPDFVVRLPK